ncbi:MAG: tRNA epoxyqueuosine(34) reductase QueG [Hyphomicrobiaceae bacterium]
MSELNTNQTRPTKSDRLRNKLANEANRLGFDSMRITPPDRIAAAGARLDRFIAAGNHGDMTWMAETADRRRNPQALWPNARSAIVVAMNYAPDENPMELLEQPTSAAISVYARGKDYHDILKGKLKQLAGLLAKETNADVKVFVDTAPLMEKPLAQAAGVGWQGKHTNLVSRSHGSWLFLGVILSAAELEPDEPEIDHCGSCSACLDVCPTDAFPAPYQLDARRCIAYLTIEYKGHIDEEFRKPIANRVFGCDDCLAVCPWNKFAQQANETRFAARMSTDAPALSHIITLDDRNFRKEFAGTPVKRTGRDRVVRNALIAAGNSADASLRDVIVARLGDTSALVRAMAVWALAQLCDGEDIAKLYKIHGSREPDSYVAAEWQQAVSQ